LLTHIGHRNNNCLEQAKKTSLAVSRNFSMKWNRKENQNLPPMSDLWYSYIVLELLNLFWERVCSDLSCFLDSQVKTFTHSYKATPFLQLKKWLYRSVLHTTVCDKVGQWLATGQWLSPVSSTNKTDC
jgi:hypothetical protein